MGVLDKRGRLVGQRPHVAGHLMLVVIQIFLNGGPVRYGIDPGRRFEAATPDMLVMGSGGVRCCLETLPFGLFKPLKL